MNTEYPSCPHCLKMFDKPGSNTTNNNRHKGCKKNPANLPKKRKCPISNYFVRKTCQVITPTVTDHDLNYYNCWLLWMLKKLFQVYLWI